MLFASLLSIPLIVLPATADVVVVVNAKNPTPELSHRELVDLYMGRSIYFSDGTMAMRLDHPRGSPIREAFYQKMLGKSVDEVNAYWAKLLFTGRVSPPQVVESNSEIISVIKNNERAIAYVDESYVDDSVRVVWRVE